MLSKYIVKPYTSPTAGVTLNHRQTFLSQLKIHAFADFMWGLHYLFSFQQDSSTMVMKWAREKIFRFWSGFERGFFSSLCARETMPKLDFLKMKKKKKTEQNSSWQHCFKHNSMGLVHGNIKFSRLPEINEYSLHDFRPWSSEADWHNG